MINPEIIETSGEQTGEEGCLSLSGEVWYRDQTGACEGSLFG